MKKVFLKIVGGSVIIFVLFAVGVAYYITRTPEYSLYKLREAIITDSADVKKYLDSESVAESLGESPAQLQEWIDSLNTSIVEIKEENRDKSKDASAYVDTELSGKNVKNASVSFTDRDEVVISLTFDDVGTRIFADITKRNIGKEIAVFLRGNLSNVLIIQNEITNGEMAISGKDTEHAMSLVDAINKEKRSRLDGFEIRQSDIRGNFAEISIGEKNSKNSLKIHMIKMDGGYWKVDKIDTMINENDEAKLPSPEGEKEVTFNWKYKGKNYSLDEKLYDSYYTFYESLPAQNIFNGESLVGELEKKNELFVTENTRDKTIGDLAQAIKSLGEKNDLNEDQIVELVASFVQTIPYDDNEYNNRETVVPKEDYPYEVLYKNKGICSDKSYLAYSLLRDLGYGVALFIFPEDQHMAIGVACPREYSNYDSGYCFLETTSMGNKIGSAPSIMEKSRIASSKTELNDFGVDSSEDQSHPLGEIEILNKINGRVYTGIIETINTQKEIESLLSAVRKMDGELNVLRKDLNDQNEEIGKMVDKLNKLAKSSDNSAYDDYKKLYAKYKNAVANFEEDRKVFNAKVDVRNQLNAKHKKIVESFYQ
ncbi:MAG: hypothetical protein WC819_04260 [Parcubacteria group bacterium]|jgi:hypothetical protein